MDEPFHLRMVPDRGAIRPAGPPCTPLGESGYGLDCGSVSRGSRPTLRGATGKGVAGAGWRVRERLRARRAAGAAACSQGSGPFRPARGSPPRNRAAATKLRRIRAVLGRGARAI